jgi:hypothetical protein
MFGYAVRYAGDLDGDGYGDLLAGVPRGGVGPARERSDVGRTMIYFGGANGFDFARTIALESPDAGVRHFGSAIGGGSDLDRDGYADLVVSHPGDPITIRWLRGGPRLGVFETLESDVGLQFISASRASFELAGTLWVGLAAQQSGRFFWYRGEPRPASTYLAEIPGFGSSVVVGDWDGDRSMDLAVGSIGQVHLFAFGAASHILLAPTDAALAGEFGRELRSIDADGDDRSDLLVAAPGSFAEPAPAHYLYFGSDAGLLWSPALEIHPD